MKGSIAPILHRKALTTKQGEVACLSSWRLSPQREGEGTGLPQDTGSFTVSVMFHVTGRNMSSKYGRKIWRNCFCTWELVVLFSLLVFFRLSLVKDFFPLFVDSFLSTMDWYVVLLSPNYPAALWSY